MSLYKNLFKQTAIYGIATVVPRMFSFLLTPLYTELLPEDEYGEVSVIFAWMVLFNVVLAYGMETAFFRFYTNEDSKKVQSTSTISIFWTSVVFLGAALVSRNYLAKAAEIDVEYITYTIWILVLDALVIIPFSKLRAEGRPMFYAIVKIGNVAVNLGLNVFFLLYLPKLAEVYPNGLVGTMYIENFQIGYIFISNVIASLLTFLVLLPHYFRISWQMDKALWRRMMRYSLPVLVAGIAFAINETFDRILLQKILPENIAETEVGIYSACYKLAIFMTLFATAFRLGIEPFFFSHAKNENAPQTYAMITKYFVIFGSVILLVVIVFADLLKVLIIRKEGYWEGMKVVPLIIMANFFLGIYHNLSVWYKLSDRTKMGAYISIVGAAVTLGLNFALIPQYSYMGSAIATIAAYSTMMVISYVLGNKHYPIPYDMKKIGGYLGLSIALSLVCFYYFRENYFVGISAIALYAGFIYSNEKATLLRIIKQR
ncbi:oligosaccharide flippase family protein [Flavobacterium sp. LaA7.5]|nr:oligosaccharide flippase family protein [Flavobacterium salilacus subsp. altitudinum]